MAIQLIFCVETNKKAATDIIYITEAINYYYKVDNSVKLSKIFMKTKTRYNSKDIVRDIHDMTKLYTFGESKVIYCIDTDYFERNQEHERQLKEISEYCEKNGYEIIWFCHDVEEVFQGRTIPDNQKVKEAGAFRRKRMIENVDSRRLSSERINCRMSNIFNVLDKYLERK